MPAGNTSNTVFKTVPAGESFTMSFSTERHFHNIAPQDILQLTFRLYDARIIGSVGSPNPTALIQQFTNLPNTGFPTRFQILADQVKVDVSSYTLDTYESTRTTGVTTVFRGELYGYIDAIVGGLETHGISLTAAPAKTIKLDVSDLELTGLRIIFLDSEDTDGAEGGATLTCVGVCKLNPFTMGVTQGN